mmetsp:Transcript_11162/g.12446  ORF Transcript_11162/g.12446 Transcript_11162/m.12446 type:complete len:269 (+) Transcript_11162:64-870(+)
MRFLLLGSRLPVNHIRASTPLSGGTRKVFGQQYSPQCSSVLRFEALLDEKDKVESATYFVKRVARFIICAHNKQPAQPLFVECTCPIIHKLSKQVVANLIGKSFSHTLRNMVEFTSTRSSPAFRHTVMEKYGLDSSSDQSSYDLVEQTLTSMIKQNNVSPRINRTNSYIQMLNESYQPLLEQAEQEEFVERYGRALRRVRKPRYLGKDHAISATPNSTLHDLSWLDVIDNYSSEQSSECKKQKNLQSPATWESYVDELYHGEQSEVSA